MGHSTSRRTSSPCSGRKFSRWPTSISRQLGSSGLSCQMLDQRVAGLLLHHHHIADAGPLRGVHHGAPAVEKRTVDLVAEIGVGEAAELVHEEHQASPTQLALDPGQIVDELACRVLVEERAQGGADGVEPGIGAQAGVHGGGNFVRRYSSGPGGP